jgi:hypothetical protein
VKKTILKLAALALAIVATILFILGGTASAFLGFFDSLLTLCDALQLQIQARRGEQ